MLVFQNECTNFNEDISLKIGIWFFLNISFFHFLFFFFRVFKKTQIRSNLLCGGGPDGGDVGRCSLLAPPLLLPPPPLLLLPWKNSRILETKWSEVFCLLGVVTADDVLDEVVVAVAVADDVMDLQDELGGDGVEVSSPGPSISWGSNLSQ